MHLTRLDNVRVSVDRTTTQNVKLSSEAVEGTEVIVEASADRLSRWTEPTVLQLSLRKQLS